MIPAASEIVNLLRHASEDERRVVLYIFARRVGVPAVCLDPEHTIEWFGERYPVIASDLLRITRRLMGPGRKTYGPMHLRNDARDFEAELQAEEDDAAIYRECIEIKREYERGDQ